MVSTPEAGKHTEPCVEFSAVDLLSLTDMKTIRDFTGRLTTRSAGNAAETRLMCDDGRGYLIEKTDAVGMTNEGPKVRGLIGSHNEEVNMALGEAFERCDTLPRHLRWNTLGTLARLRTTTQEKMAAWNENAGTYRTGNYDYNPLLALQEYIARTGNVPATFNILPGIVSKTKPDELMGRLFSPESGFEFRSEKPVKQEYPSASRNYFYTISGLVVPR
ncbi:MAG: hypothetical protein NUV52_04410 [Candidatus Roizmanbacteria bacterium]|nr:hypothetical protein [Candidatus Roizmanbacteria bacterium]